MKKLYRVQLNEIHISSWDVEATSEQDAVNEVLDGAGELLHTEYSYTPDWNDKTPVDDPINVGTLAICGVDAVHHVTCTED